MSDKGVYIRSINRDRMYQRAIQPYVLNQDTATLGNDWIDRVTTVRQGGELDAKPKCHCGHYNKVKYLKEYCPECNTQCLYQSQIPLDVTTFLGKLDGTVGYLNPKVYYQMRDIFGIDSSVKIIDYLLDQSYPEPKEGNMSATAWNKFQVYKALNIPRGYNYFCTHFLEIINKLTSPRDYIEGHIDSSHLVISANSYKRKREILTYAEMVTPNLICQFEPLLNAVCFVLERKAGAARYKTMKSSNLQQEAVNIIMAQQSTKDFNGSLDKRTQRKHENAMARYVRKHYELDKEIFREVLGGKPGIVRKDCVGVRPDGSGRCVISLAGIQYGVDTDGFEIPWMLGVELFRPELHNYLANEMGWSKVKRRRFLSQHERRYHPLIDNLINERFLKETCEGRGDPNLLNRNPILYQFSNQCKYIRRIKTDVHDLTLTVPVTCCAAYNSDFDGDEQQFVRVVDEKGESLIENLKIRKGLIDRSHGRRFNGLLDLPKPLLQLLHAYTAVYE